MKYEVSATFYSQLCIGSKSKKKYKLAAISKLYIKITQKVISTYWGQVFIYTPNIKFL